MKLSYLGFNDWFLLHYDMDHNLKVIAYTIARYHNHQLVKFELTPREFESITTKD
jgi:accessory gene regulator protein AgrB